ncbi:hypothetical protein LLG96_06595 [bacterium]|nr:hypothetical protein [bacterium]
MKILFYSKNDNQFCRKFCEMVESVIPDCDKEVYRSIESLQNSLCRPLYYDTAIGVFFITDHHELSEIMELQALFRNIRLIVLLPDRQKETITKGHTLHPRFLSFVDNNHSEILAILEKMTGKDYTEKSEHR